MAQVWGVCSLGMSENGKSQNGGNGVGKGATPEHASQSQLHYLQLNVRSPPPPERELFIDNLLVRIHCIIVMIRWTGLAPWEFEFPFPGSIVSTFLNSQRLKKNGPLGEVHLASQSLLGIQTLSHTI